MQSPELIAVIEAAIAAEAAAHARATLELNHLSEAESLELGTARAVFTGSFSSVHGVFGLGLDGYIENQDFESIEKFYQKKERAPAFWICPATDPSLKAFLGLRYKATITQKVHAALLSKDAASPFHRDPATASPFGNASTPDLQEWMVTFAQGDNPNATEPSLISFTKIHQKETRFYSHAGTASYTFFHRGIALVPNPPRARLLALQWEEARDFGAKVFATLAPSALPLLYERTLFEKV
ncbi:MAG: hypothetical protein ACXWQO_10690 [Bdellovibrionota bacterium]